MDGVVIALLGIALAAILAGAGSAIGVSIAGQTGSGVLSEKPDLFGRVLILQALPGTQGIYGFLMAILLLTQGGFLNGRYNEVFTTKAVGWQYFAAAMPIAIVGLISGIYQGKAAASSILMTGKKPAMSASGMTMTALVETYAILALLVSILMYTGLPTF